MNLRWLSITVLPHTHFGWEADTDIDGLDPYAVWADGMDFSGMGVTHADLAKGVPLLIELDFGRPFQQKHAAAPTDAPSDAPLEVPASIASNKAGFSPLEYLEKTLSVYINEANRKVLEAGGDLFTVHGLVPLDQVRKIRGHVRLPIPSRQLGLRALLSLPRMVIGAGVMRALEEQQVKGPTIAIIDDGCPFAHAKFRYRDAAGIWKSRIAYLWDQSRNPDGVPVEWKLPADFKYGREVTKVDIEEFIKRHIDPDTLEVKEDECYADERYGSVQPRWTHGSVVTDIAAGAPDPLASFDASPDVAATAPIIFVQLPRGAVEDPSSGALPGFVVDALRYIEARTTVGGVPQPVAINLSYGTFAGPHDGTSPVEVAIDTFLSGRKDCAVMISAGNAYDAQIHAEIRIAPNDYRTLSWDLAAGDATHNFMEIWLPPTDEADLPPVVDVRLVPPADWTPPSPLTGPGQAWFGVAVDDPLDRPICAVVHPSEAPQGTIGSMILLAVGATQGDPAIWPIAPAGIWKVEIHNQGSAPLTIDAWVERDDPSFQLGKQSRFEDPDLVYVKPTITLGSFSHASQAIVVGACVDDLSSGRPVSAYSSAGPGRMGLARVGPDFAAGGDESITEHGLRAAGTRSADTVRVSGTSVASAVVTRHVVNEVLSTPSGQTAGEIKAAVPCVPCGPQEGPWRVGRGRIKALGP